MSQRQVLIVDTGVANIRSMMVALERLNCQCQLTQSAEDIRTAPYLVLPGVGTFAAAMQQLNQLQLVAPLQDRLRSSQSTLCVCLGWQLLGLGSEESPGVTGLGILPVMAQRFPNELPVPQLGWNAVVPQPGCDLPGGMAYFANSFRISDPPPQGWQYSVTNYGGPFISCAQRDQLLACQFHPELSGDYGMHLLASWLAQKTVVNTHNDWGQLTRRIIPCLDVRGGRVVKGVQFAQLRDAGDPAELAARYAEQGADELVMLDVSATLEQRQATLDTVRKIRQQINLPLTVGGGVRSEQDAAQLLQAGADKISINSAAVADPELIDKLARRFGSQCTVVAIDVRRAVVEGAVSDREPTANRFRDSQRWQVLTHSGSRVALEDGLAWIQRVVELGAGEILLTSHDRDGTGHGYDLELLQAATSLTRVPLIASGGAAHWEHLAAAFTAGAHAVLAATIFHDDHTTVGQVKQQLAASGVKVR